MPRRLVDSVVSVILLMCFVRPQWGPDRGTGSSVRASACWVNPIPQPMTMGMCLFFACLFMIYAQCQKTADGWSLQGTIEPKIMPRRGQASGKQSLPGLGTLYAGGGVKSSAKTGQWHPLILSEPGSRHDEVDEIPCEPEHLTRAMADWTPTSQSNVSSLQQEMKAILLQDMINGAKGSAQAKLLSRNEENFHQKAPCLIIGNANMVCSISFKEEEV